MKAANILKAITHVMPCDKCPYPCKAKRNSSQANCDRHWFEMLSKVTWGDIHDIHEELIAEPAEDET